MNNTTEIRKFLNETINQMKNGEISNAVARSRLLAARIYVDTVKVDLVAIQLGQSVAKSLTFNGK